MQPRDKPFGRRNTGPQDHLFSMKVWNYHFPCYTMTLPILSIKHCAGPSCGFRTRALPVICELAWAWLFEPLRLIRRLVPRWSYWLAEFFHLSDYVVLREYSKSHAYGRVVGGDLGETLGFLDTNVSFEQSSSSGICSSGKLRPLETFFRGVVWVANSQVFALLHDLGSFPY